MNAIFVCGSLRFDVCEDSRLLEGRKRVYG